MEPESLLLHSQEPATCPYPEPFYVAWSLTTKHEVPVWIPGSTMGIFPYRERFPW